MDELTFGDLDKRLFTLFEAKEFAQILALIEQVQARFPEHTLEFSYWQICMNNLLGRQEQALQLFRAVLERGLWFDPDWLVEDEDLETLRPSPAFQEMVAFCRQRRDKAQAEARPELRVFPPKQEGTSWPLLIALHKNNGNADKACEKWREVTEWGWLLAVPQSTQIREPGFYRWDDRERSIQEVRDHFVALENDFPMDRERIVLGGFSKGGCQAIWLTLHQLIPTNGFLVLAPSFSEGELEALSSLLATQRPANIRGYIIAGEKDERCLRVAHKIVEMMQAHDLPCELEVQAELEHVYPLEILEWGMPLLYTSLTFSLISLPLSLSYVIITYVKLTYQERR